MFFVTLEWYTLYTKPGELLRRDERLAEPTRGEVKSLVQCHCIRETELRMQKVSSAEVNEDPSRNNGESSIITELVSYYILSC